MVGEADFPRPRGMAPADQAGVGEIVVRGAEGSGPQKRLLPVRRPATEKIFVVSMASGRERSGMIVTSRCAWSSRSRGDRSSEGCAYPAVATSSARLAVPGRGSRAEIEGIVADSAKKFREIITWTGAISIQAA